MRKSRFILPIALALAICALLAPLVSAATYYITDVYSSGIYWSGQVLGASYIEGSADSSFANIRGLYSAGDGGYIVGTTDTVSYPSTFQIRAFSGSGYESYVHVYVSYNSGGPWYEVGDGVEVEGTTAQWYTVGSTTRVFRYVAVASIYEGGEPTYVFIDCVKITT